MKIKGSLNYYTILAMGCFISIIVTIYTSESFHNIYEENTTLYTDNNNAIKEVDELSSLIDQVQTKSLSAYKKEDLYNAKISLQNSEKTVKKHFNQLKLLLKNNLENEKLYFQADNQIQQTWERSHAIITSLERNRAQKSNKELILLNKEFYNTRATLARIKFNLLSSSESFSEKNHKLAHDHLIMTRWFVFGIFLLIIYSIITGTKYTRLMERKNETIKAKTSLLKVMSLFPENNPYPIFKIQLSTGLILFANTKIDEEMMGELKEVNFKAIFLDSFDKNGHVKIHSRDKIYQSELKLSKRLYKISYVVKAKINMALAYGLDITDLNNQITYKENILQELNIQTYALNEHSLVSVTNPMGKITYANEKFCEISGYPLEEVLGHSHRLVNSKYHPQSFWTSLWGTITRGKLWQGEICNKAKDGSIYWVYASIIGYKDTEGKITKYVAIRNDITNTKIGQKNIEIALNKANELAEAKSHFLANMSHEVRTPMNGVLGTISLLENTKLDKEQKELVDIAKSSSDGLLTVLNDVLDFSKVDFGKLELDMDNFDLHKSVKEVIQLLKAKAKEKKITINLYIDDSTPRHIFGDKVRINQILLNLLSNAIKFTDVGNVTLDIISRDLNQEQIHIDFKVTDTGIGISEENQKRIFEAFTQADSTTTRKYGGTGLGLAISSKMAKVMNGKIDVQGHEGKGSIFTLTLPLHLGTPNKELETVVKKGHINISQETVGNILVVEDNVVNQKLTRLMLNKLGLNCDIVENGQQALDLIDDEGVDHYKIIFMDMQMPVMDGVTATEKIVEKYPHDHPKIIAMTANVFEEDKQRCFKAGMEDFLPKPVRLEEIKRVLSEVKKAA
jgi:PAS domain S-box-containing protein